MNRITAFLLPALVVATVHAQVAAPGATINIGGNCSGNKDCAIQNSYCDNGGTCACLEGFEQFTDKTPNGLEKSVCAKGLSQPCGNDSECFTDATCSQGICICNATQGLVPSKDSKRCLHRSGSFNTSSCSGVVECPDWGDGTLCDSNICTCQPEFHFYEDKCYYSSKLGDTCGEAGKNKRCFLPSDGNNQHVTCSEKTKKCECMRGYKPSDDQTKCKVKPFDGTCHTNDDCTNVYGMQAECSQKKCKCKAEHHLYNNTCCFNLALGNQCDFERTMDRCYLPLDGNQQHVECGSSKICECSHGFKPANNNQQCISGSPIKAIVPAYFLSAFILLKVASY